MSSLTTIRLGSLGRIITGSTPPAAHPEWFATSGVPFVTPSDIIEGQRRVRTQRFLSKTGAQEMSRRLIPENAICFVSIGSTIGKTCFTTSPSVTNQQINSLVVDESVADPMYIYYALSQISERVKVTASGSATPILNKTMFAAIELSVLPLPEQRAIAATLGALDDKIESNRRAIEIIQHTVSAIFTRWKSEASFGTASTFGAYADVYGGATPKTTVPDYWGGGLAWSTPTDVTRLSAPYLFETSRTITDEGLRSCATVLHPAGTIFMTSRATIGAFAINQIPAAANQGFIAVRPRREIDRYFLFEEMRSRVDEFLDNANGSTFLEISRGRFKELSLGVPSPAMLEILNGQIGPMHRKAAQLALESNRLATLRDALLPELLSGRIRTLPKVGM
ncbi:restriction endonuclease subunit S [Buchananella hordeovulneris]|uniref:restriction endonuclease subunit S n=1 Tax=Buchananella hordeovulneris TaxID=52770 RepID=UPI0026DBEB21|nr:restriction endonuclease subunit S [Buchananella hordeovulneris]MDO5080124.1 restriction endonuclease subunit S [Buchananella hordeovulneris]